LNPLHQTKKQREREAVSNSLRTL